MKAWSLAFIALAIPGAGCASLNELAEAYVRGQRIQAGLNPGPTGVGSPTKLMVFGGQGHKTYLGCLTCSEHATDSILNQYGTHGSQYGMASVMNPYGTYGSRYSAHSTCNPYASDPPVIVDGAGTFYGRLTVNPYHRQRTNDPQLQAWIAGVCQGR